MRHLGWNLLLLCTIIFSVRGWALEPSPIAGPTTINDAQLLTAKENTIKVTRLAAQMGAISMQEALELERKIAPMSAQEFKAYLEAETASAQNQQDISGGKIDEKQLKKFMEEYKDLVPTNRPK